MRPEMIGLTLENNFEKNFKYNEQEIKEISIKIENCIEQTFNKPYIKCLDEIKKGQRAISNVYAKDYTSSTQTNGLGFGIITNSTSNALLYQAMNNHEIEKQNKLNRMNYENNVIKSTGDVMLEKMKKVEQIYYNFGDEIIKTIQTILEN